LAALAGVRTGRRFKQRRDPGFAEGAPERTAATGAGGRRAMPLSTTSYATNVFANDPNLDNPNFGDAQSEPGVAVHGSNIVVAWNDFRGSHDPTLPGFIAYASSTNGGQSFTQGGVPPFAPGRSACGRAIPCSR
jgi:hypothetical protein